MRFTEFRYLWPPRPVRAVPTAVLGHYEKQEWLAQVKMNGTCNVLAVSPDRQIHAMSRHNDKHKLWTPNADSARAFQNLPGDGWYVFVAELLHSKVPGIRNVNYLHDVLVADGEYLYGKTYLHRLHKLADLFADQLVISDEQHNRLSHLVVDQCTWLAKSHHHGFKALFDQTRQHPEMEGLVLKNPWAELKACLRPDANASWSVKCRHPTKAFSS